MSRILVVDDDIDTCTLLKNFLEKQGHSVQSCYNGEETVIEAKTNPYDLVLSDFRLPDIDGYTLLEKFKVILPDTPVIIITGYSDIKSAVEVIKAGAFDYLTKPLNHEQISEVVKDALRSKKPAGEPAKSRTGKRRMNRDFVKSVSANSETLYKHVELVAPTDMTVVIHGETGVGKEYIARLIHQSSERSGETFMAIDCGALTNELAGSELFGHEKGAFTGATTNKKGSFEAANGGTLFLDEIGNLSYENQVKLLRAIQERKIRRVGGLKDIDVDVRIVAASNVNLRDKVEEGEFREDLFHRLNEFSIFIPPLHERPEDIRVYALHFIRQSNDNLNKNVEGFDEEAENILLKYNWPGNLRELKNVIKRAVLLSEEKSVITKNVLPPELRNYQQFSSNGDEFTGDGDNLKHAASMAEREKIIQTLQQFGNNKTKTAEALKIDRKTLYNKLNEYKIDY